MANSFGKLKNALFVIGGGNQIEVGENQFDGENTQGG